MRSRSEVRERLAAAEKNYAASIKRLTLGKNPMSEVKLNSRIDAQIAELRWLLEMPPL